MFDFSNISEASLKGDRKDHSIPADKNYHWENHIHVQYMATKQFRKYMNLCDSDNVMS